MPNETEIPFDKPHWSGGPYDALLCMNGVSADSSKYNEVEGKDKSQYILKISNFSESDVDCEYECVFGVDITRTTLHLNKKDYEYIPARGTTSVISSLMYGQFSVNIHIVKVWPTPDCEIIFELALKSRKLFDRLHLKSCPQNYTENKNEIQVHLRLNFTKRVRMSKMKNGKLFSVNMSLKHVLRSDVCSGEMLISCQIGTRRIEVERKQFDTCPVTDTSVVMNTKLKILICGGGNGAHCLAVFASQRKNIEVNILTLHEGSADLWNSSLKEGGLTISATQPDGSVENIESSPSFVTKDAAAAMNQIQVVFIVAPAYRHELYIRSILPYINRNMLVVGLPGHAGFELQCKYILGDKSRICTIVGFDSLPWGCRVVDYGKHVRLLGKKDVVYATMLTGFDCQLQCLVIETIQYILGEKPVIKLASNFLSVSLMAGSILHPPLMYGKWKDWDGQPLTEVPSYFYNSK
ncbi:unnamed protein product [Mytilus coruscus]|uniref:Uncharacterized protein n=1 Tax=Mytilus coruscus TaxID=42192 RepID=A0A6J8E9F4_MYTCO|nr:unnamed protein product [Mytilus coruscus]